VNTVHLELGDQSYDICIGQGLIGRTDLLTEQIVAGQVFVISNETVASLHLDTLLESLADYQVDVHLIPEGEQFKTLDTIENVVGSLLSRGHNRTTTIFALGGGVVGDTAGFVAASYQRGVAFVQVPTTLLSQVDSSVGGKTAVNHPLGKNMIGAFYQPKAVYIDTETLKTLPPRELSAGLAEVIKHGVLADSEYFEFIEANIDRLRQLDDESLQKAILGSCEIKAAVVSADEKERGQRALLNFGHTFGHAIETGVGYGSWLHGEAIGAGMVMAADLSMRLGRCSAAEGQRIKQLIAHAGLPVSPPEDLDAGAFIGHMSKDKKATDTGIRFVLMAGSIGRTEVVDNVPVEALLETLNAGSALCQ
jgi:3-dehydroquinate synthase